MSPTQEMREALADAVAAAGGQVGFAQVLTTPDRPVSQQIVSYWSKRGYLPAELVIRVELKVGVSRYRLRPDVFCVPQDLLPLVA
ncbi:YdaS family helix-turn-helix protein [Pseudomonas aeruginosa]|uniref:YdaS family helix-turn-helix protein n=1 Tax=Pseudomonas aeruginosa TaxID=287 RepID=UPI000F889DC8|nr:YdaS family helix-turn-helix protein [Pseudomonas aeruginosa]RSZ54201.1 transcriptional regulator [Pseudomonas aeruginosa]WOT63805.1 YdaS family helix-turn-helix protein [Pseudomonas aeruginosa]WOT75919.1 YdaS family helix-turn-helix protein [Pseudomonas aeruginosa]WOT89850.1 YdaS family helix-turn-helix protein [Pseudomonas aeruginosa]WOU02777.1 YdaS family helix-turn-helix protein [Pseudomonas aeruginosa]